MPTEACPCTDFDWMRILVHTVLRIQRLALGPTNDHLTMESHRPPRSSSATDWRKSRPKNAVDREQNERYTRTVPALSSTAPR